MSDKPTVKKSSSDKKPFGGSRQAPAKKRNSNQSNKTAFYLIGAGIVLFTFVVFSGVLSADFLDWDDPTFVLGNKNITSLSFAHLKNMFSTYCMGNYCPFTILSYAVDYHFAGGLHPAMFHVTSLLLHLANTFLVYVFVYLLANRSTLVAAVAAVLFAIHPMHLESVAWIAERRDVLYTLFFLLGLVSYLKYLESEKVRKWESERETSQPQRTFSLSHFPALSFAFYIGSLLSKGQAVTFPAVLLVVDYIYRRKIDTKAIIEKIPFFVLSLIFGYIAVVAQKTTPSVNVMHVSRFNSLFIGNYALLLYIVKSVIPFKLTGYHPYPFTSGADIPFIIRLAPLIIVGFAVLVIASVAKQSRVQGTNQGIASSGTPRNDKNRIIVGGLLFFLITIFPVLQFLPVGETIISERYTYIPYIGLFFIVANVAFGGVKPASGYGRYLAVGLIVIFTIITVSRISVWKNSVNFWSDVIDHYPDNKIPYNNRGYMYNEFGQYNEAIADFNKGIAIDSTYGRLYLNRGLAYARQKMYDLAMTDYNKSVKYDTTEQQTYMNRGGIYTDILNKYDSGISDFQHVLRINPESIEAIDNMGVAYFKKEDYDKALEQYTKSLYIKPDDGKVYYFRALVYAAKKDYANAIADAEQSRRLGYAVDENLFQQWKQQR